MKNLAYAGIFAAGLLAASPSYALDLTGSYLATFSVVHSATKTICFQLTSTGAAAPYKDTGSVTSAKFPAFTGSYVVYKSSFHLAFTSSGKASLAVTGTIANGTLVHSSATEFTNVGRIDNIGTLASTASCP